MWNRADLKANAKKIFFGNYWKAVLVTLILTIILGGATNTITRRISNNQSTDWSIDQDFSGVSSYDEWSNDEILNIGNSSLYGSEYQTYLRIQPTEEYTRISMGNVGNCCSSRNSCWSFNFHFLSSTFTGWMLQMVYLKQNI